MKASARPADDEVNGYFANYIGKAQGDDLFRALNKASDRLWETVYRIPTGHADHRYAPGKWSIKEVFQHVLDSERIFCYRALRFARNDATELPGFDENVYIENADTGHRELHELLREHDVVRVSTIALFRSFTDEMLLRSGIANGSRISVRALGWTIAGHVTHHMEVIDERYLTGRHG
jgi:uncharacterized damage-inducible protein DinB